MSSKKVEKLFGTDGIRGTANREPMSVDTILRVGRAAACVFRRAGDRRHAVLIGKDTRVSGYMFETALVAGLSSMGVDVYLVGPIPTPGVAYLTSDMRVDAGVVISASHNPYNDNGLKFFGPDGFKLRDEIETSIERLVGSDDELNRQRPAPDKLGKATRLDDGRGRYISYLKHMFPRYLSLDGVRMVLDCANGAGYKIAPAVFEELGATVTAIGCNPDGRNINEACGAVHVDQMINAVRDEKAQIGIALDGDGDRVVLCDDKGRIFDGDDILVLLAESLQKQNELGGGVVGTVMSNFGLERHLKKAKIPFMRAPVGDRYVVEMMKESGALLGGEPSGHIVTLSKSTTGDGILSALLVLAELIRRGKPLSAFHGYLERFPQELRNVDVQKRTAFEKLPRVTASIQNAEKQLNGIGRVLVRYSGTEPKARVMVEGENGDLVRTLADEIASTIQREIGAR